MPSFFDIHHTVVPDEIDAQGHVHNLRYLAWTLHAASRHSAALGWDSERMLRDHGTGWVVRSHDVTYRLAALSGDEIVVRTWVSELARHAATRRYWVCRPEDRKVLARVTTRWAMVDLRVRRAIEIPEAIASRMTVLHQAAPLPWEPSGGDPAPSEAASSEGPDSGPRGERG